MTVVAAASIAALHVAWVVLQIGGEHATQVFSDLIVIPVAVAVTAACVFASRRETGRGRRGWLLVAGAVASWGAGSAVWAWYELVSHQEVPFPSLADAGYLGMIPLAAAGLLCFVGGRNRVSNLRIALQGLLIAGCLLFLGWAALLGESFHAATGSLPERLIGLAYPIGDIALIAIALFAVPRTPRTYRMPLILVGVGLAFIAASDAGFTVLTQHDAYRAGNPIDAGWTIGFLFVGLAAVRSRLRPGIALVVQAAPRLAPAIATYAAVAIAMTTAGVVEIFVGALSRPLFWIALVNVAMLLLHQVLLTTENFALNYDLEKKVAERTDELKSALAEVEDANRLQNAFVASVSHELRTPLTNLLGAASTLQRPQLELSGVAAELVSSVERNATRMNKLIEDLLLVAGLGNKDASYDYPFEVVSETRAIVEASPVAARVTISGTGRIISSGHPTRYRTALMHLLDNVAKFAPSGAVTIDIHDDGTEIVVGVCDQGPGVPASRRDKIFDRFVQADDSMTRAHEGAGLGLFIARRMLEGIGGRIWLDPEVTEGARFCVALRKPEAFEPSLTG
jgi:signal transduction histidine kinase